MICKCKDIKMGSYDNQIELELPWKNELVGIDICILEEILSLWIEGKKTIASCCGHGITEPIIAYNN